MTNFCLLSLAVAPFVVVGLRLIADLTWIIAIAAWLFAVCFVSVVTVLWHLG